MHDITNKQTKNQPTYQNKPRKKPQHKTHHILSHGLTVDLSELSAWIFLFSTTLQNLKVLNFFTELYFDSNSAEHKAVLAHSSIVETLEWYLE